MSATKILVALFALMAVGFLSGCASQRQIAAEDHAQCTRLGYERGSP